MMTDRFLAWIAVRAQEDTLRLGMALFGIFIAVLWASIGLWPKELQYKGRRAFLFMGGISYAILFAVAVGALVRALFFSR